MSERAKQIAEKIRKDMSPITGPIMGFEAAVEKHMLRPHQVQDDVGDVWEQMSDGRYRLLIHGLHLAEIDKKFGPLTTIQGDPTPDASEIAKLKKRIAELESEDCHTANAALQNVAARQQKRIAELEAKTKKPHQVKDRYGREWETMSDGLYRPMVMGVTEDKIEEFADSFYKKMAESGEIAKLKERIAELEKDLANKIEAMKAYHKLVDKRDDQIEELERQLAEAKAEPAKQQPEAIWQQIDNRLWVFGVPIRGVVREQKAFVRDCGASTFTWGARDSCGSAHAFIEAIDAAEKAMGIS